MTDKREFEDRMWKSIRKDMTVMVTVDGADSHPRPLTAQFDGDADTSIYFFTASDTELAGQARRARKATLSFASKGHDLFATIHGKLSTDKDRKVVDRLWNRFVAAWFEKGKDDPKLVLLRFDPAEAEVWLDASSLIAGFKMLLGIDPKEDYRKKVATLKLK